MSSDLKSVVYDRLIYELPFYLGLAGAGVGAPLGHFFLNFESPVPPAVMGGLLGGGMGTAAGITLAIGEYLYRKILGRPPLRVYYGRVKEKS